MTEQTKAQPNTAPTPKEQRDTYLKLAKQYREKVVTFLENKKNDRRILTGAAVIISVICIYNIITTYTMTQDLNKKSSELSNISNYNLQDLKTNINTKRFLEDAKEIQDVAIFNTDLKEENKRYQKYKENLQSPYTNFLQYILLPKLNIRKEPYTETLQMNILGESFIKNNPYNDTNLFQKWSDFLTTADKNQINDIKDLDIGDITETKDGFYNIPISFSFTAPSKTTLIFLIDKLTTTSDKENINLIGEFFYYLRQEVKKDKKEAIAALTKTSTLSGDKNEDTIIGYDLHNRVFNNKETTLIDNTLIQKTIFTMMECKPDTDQICYYNFREKFRTISNLAYTIGNPDNTKKNEDLRTFLKNLPPLIAIESFTFDKVKDNGILQTANTKYQGKVKLNIYGQSITTEDTYEIANTLGEKCFGTKKTLTVEEAQKIVEDTISKRSSLVSIDEDTNDNIRDLKNNLELISKEFPTLNNYKKTIRLFEMYRMLNEGGLCKTI